MPPTREHCNEEFFLSNNVKAFHLYTLNCNDSMSSMSRMLANEWNGPAAICRLYANTRFGLGCVSVSGDLCVGDALVIQV